MTQFKVWPGKRRDLLPRASTTLLTVNGSAAAEKSAASLKYLPLWVPRRHSKTEGKSERGQTTSVALKSCVALNSFISMYPPCCRLNLSRCRGQIASISDVTWRQILCLGVNALKTVDDCIMAKRWPELRKWTFVIQGLVTLSSSRELHNQPFECPIRAHLDVYLSLSLSLKPVGGAAASSILLHFSRASFPIPTIHLTNGRDP